MRPSCLIITPFAPLPPEQAVDGVFRRLRLFISALRAICGRMDFLCIAREAESAVYTDEAALEQMQTEYWAHPTGMKLVPLRRRRETFLSHYLAGVVSAGSQPPFHPYAGPQQIAAVHAALSASPDIVFVHRLSAMNAVLRTGLTPRRMFFDLDDLEHILRIRTALERPVWLGKLAYLTHVPALLIAESRGIARSQETFVTSDKDAAHLRAIGLGNRVTVIPNGVALPVQSQARPSACPTLLFIGGQSYKPNRDAAERLVGQIWPRIRQQMPSARLRIVGKQPELNCYFRMPQSNVEFLGFVENLDQLYAETAVVVCPVTLGAGTRVKLIEAASYGKPIVSTRIGAEGLHVRDGVDILLRDADDDFAAACVGLLRDPNLARRLGSAARATVEGRYDSRHIQNRLVRIFTT